MLLTLNIKILFDLGKRWESTRLACVGTFIQPVPSQQVWCSLPSSQPQQQLAQTTRRLPAGRTARSRVLLFALATHEQGYWLVLLGAVSLDYEITRGLERIAESLMLTGTAH
jgi:hypothetical protein